MRIVISSRKSDLARIQALNVGRALKKDDIKIEFRFRESLGDKNLTDPLWKMPERGVFTEDFLEDLINGKTDMVVHSWKDLPVEERSSSRIVATLPRADQRDILLVRKDKWTDVNKSKRLRLFSSSPRRAYNLENFLKDALPGGILDVIFESVRGNVPTRIQKMGTSDSIDGLVVAKAALDRLLEAEAPEFKGMQEALRTALEECLIMVLPLEKNPTAAAQGALAIEINSERKDLEELLKTVHCENTFSAVEEERDILKGYGGGCHQKVGVSVRHFSYGRITYVRALTDKGETIDSVKFLPKKLPPKVDLKFLFPETSNASPWFTRECFDVKVPSDPLWVSKAEALPEHAPIEQGRLIWASGWETWKRLAKRDLWVSGCSESLGEDSGLENFAFWKNINWTKLTHEAGVHRGKKVIATYKLVPLEKSPDLQGKTHFYWTSGSSFERALELNPWLKSAHHSCGPGNSYDVISKHVDVSIFPGYKIWKENMAL